MSLDPDLRELAQGTNFAALSTLTADGRPRTHVMWIDADDEHLIVNTDRSRAKFADVERDPRVTVTVIDQANPYRYIEARGRVVETVTGAPAAEHIDRLSQRYSDKPYWGDTDNRVIVKIAPEKLHKNGF